MRETSIGSGMRPLHGLGLVAALLCGGPSAAQSLNVAGEGFESSIQVGGRSLVLNGAGVRTRAFFEIYAAGLYVPRKSSDAAVLLAQTGPRCVVIRMLRSVAGATLAGALHTGLKNNLSARQLAVLEPEIEALGRLLESLGEARRGAAIAFEFTPEAGTRIVVNGRQIGAAIPGERLFPAVLSVWIGDNPADRALKRGLLGGSR